MYAREYPQHKSGAVRAFEDAYAKEEFLRRSANQGEHGGCTGKSPQDTAREVPCEPLSQPEKAERDNMRDRKQDCMQDCMQNCIKEESVCPAKENRPAVPEKECGLKKLFGGTDNGDLLLILLIFFFLSDSDKENDMLIPVLLAILLLF
ncbi:MAG: hypothetical protein ACI4RV_03695 [Eubacteriales bacterium]